MFVYDATGKQSTTDFSIIVSEPHDPCIYAYISNNSSAKQTVFRKGSKICLYDWCYVWDNQTYSPGICNEISLVGNEYIEPKYQGISRIIWYLNGDSERDVPFNTTQYYYSQTGDIQYPNFPKYYYAGDYQFPTHISLNNTGYNTITLEAYGGKMKVSDDASQFIHPFPFGSMNNNHHGPSIATKNFLVVDCESVWNVSGTSQLFSNSGEGHALANVFVNPNPSLVVNSGESVNWTTYNKIVINQGFRVENGGRFVATAKRCPDLVDCNSASERNNNIKHQSNVPMMNPITVYPNPAKDYVSIVNGNGYKYEIFNSQGSKALSGDILNDDFTFSIVGLKPGIYLINFNSVNGQNKNKQTQKIIIY